MIFGAPMKNNESVDLLGKELSFYAKYPEEMDFTYVDQVDAHHRKLFSFLDKKQFQEMEKMVATVGDAAAEQARELTAEVVDELLKLKGIKAESIKRTNYWEAGLRIRKTATSADTNVECRVRIETVGEQLAARVWIWVKGSKSADLMKVLKRSIRKLPEQPKNFDGSSVLTAAIDLREAVEQRRSKQSIVDELAAPLFQLDKDQWHRLFMLAE